MLLSQEGYTHVLAGTAASPAMSTNHIPGLLLLCVLHYYPHFEVVRAVSERFTTKRREISKQQSTISVIDHTLFEFFGMSSASDHEFKLANQNGQKKRFVFPRRSVGR